MYLALSLKPYLLFFCLSEPLNQSHCLLYPLAGFIPVPLYLSATLSVYFSCSVFSGVDALLLFPLAFFLLLLHQQWFSLSLVFPLCLLPFQNSLSFLLQPCPNIAFLL